MGTSTTPDASNPGAAPAAPGAAPSGSAILRAVPPPGAAAQAVDPNDPLGLFGSTIGGRLAVVRYLGRTHASYIYRVVHMIMERPCFLKITEKDPDRPGGLPPSIEREVAAATRVRHPAILKPLDAGTTGAWAHLTQEWSDGPNLRVLIDQNPPLTVPDMLGVAMQLLDALCELHRAGIVLRAFDPERILVPNLGGRYVLRLFDMSRVAYVGERLAQESVQSSRRATGFAIRSTRYMAPDEIREGAADPRSDLYSMGVLLFEMLTGQYPYAVKGQGPTAYVVSHLREAPRKLDGALRDELPADLPGIIERMLAKRPEDRFETAEACRRAIMDVVVPDLVRLNNPAQRHVLETWRKRVQRGLGRTLEREAIDPADLPPGF